MSYSWHDGRAPGESFEVMVMIVDEWYNQPCEWKSPLPNACITLRSYCKFLSYYIILYYYCCLVHYSIFMSLSDVDLLALCFVFRYAWDLEQAIICKRLHHIISHKANLRYVLFKQQNISVCSWRSTSWLLSPTTVVQLL